MEYEMQPYGVYVQADAENRITAINSDAFLPSLDGWVKIDEGYGDKCHHAQGNYFPKPIRDERGICRYKIVPFVDWPEGKILQEFSCEGEEYGIFERTQAEMDADYVPPTHVPSESERISALEVTLAAYEAAYTEGVNEA